MGDAGQRQPVGGGQRPADAESPGSFITVSVLSAAVLEVLLDLGALLVGADLGMHAGRDGPGAETDRDF